mgnify:CR=1 FL=1
MPLLIAGLIRAAIQFAVTIGIVEIAERAILPLINRAIREVVEAFGVDEQQATDLVANSWLVALEEIGIAAIAIKSKTPVKIAEMLGFTSKGFGKRALSANLTSKLASTAGVAVKAPGILSATANQAVQQIAKARGINLDTAAKLAQLLVATLGIPIGAGLLLINTIDFAAWPTSRYNTTFQKFFAFFGLEADVEKVSTKVLSDDQFTKAYEVFRLEGAVQINNPYIGQVVPFTRENLVALLDKIAATILVEAGKYTINQVIAASIGYIITGEKPKPETPAVAGTPAKPFVPSTLPKKGKTTFTASPDELSNLALGKVAEFLDGITTKLDFELTTKTNPIDDTGKFLAGNFYALRVYLRSGQFAKTKLTEIILRPLAESEKKLTTAEEEPFEAALRFGVGASQTAPTFAVPVVAPTPTPKPAVITPQPTPAVATAPSLSLAAKIQQGIERPYIRFGGDYEFAFAKLTGRKIPRDEFVGEDYFNKQLVENKPMSEFANYKFGEATTTAPTTAVVAPSPTTPTPLPIVQSVYIAPTFVPTPTPSKPYVQFAGSPDVFERSTGRWINQTEAQQKNIFGGGLIESINKPRPEVKVANDFAVWSQKSLTTLNF